MTGARILVVEDDAMLRDAVDIILSQVGYQVTGVGTGEDGLGIVRRFRPHLILLDVRMPGMNGIETLRRLRRDGHTMPVLMLTADTSPATVRDVMAAGGNGYVLKPFEPKQLIQRVQNFLTGPGAGYVVLDV